MNRRPFAVGLCLLPILAAGCAGERNALAGRNVAPSPPAKVEYSGAVDSTAENAVVRGESAEITVGDEPAIVDPPPRDPNPEPVAPERRVDTSPRPPTTRTVAAPAPKTDPAVVAASSTEANEAVKRPTLGRYPLAMRIATVGTEVITRHDLQVTYKDFKRDNVPANAQLTADQVDEIVRNLLEQLIDRSVLNQEARRTLMKSENQKKMFKDFCEKSWGEQALPPLMRKMGVKNEVELSLKLDEQGRSLEELKENHRREFLAREFLLQRLKGRIHPDYPAQRAYYDKHREEFNRPAMIHWREIVIKVGEDGDRAKARKQADALLARLRRGVDFAMLAKAESAGPTASTGGVWQTQLNASAVPAVNSALEQLPVGRDSQVIEGPKSFHIIRIEDRKPAGPAKFEEVQEEIRKNLTDENFKREMTAFVNGLRSKTVIVYHLEPERDAKPGPDPAAIRTSTTSAAPKAARPR